MARILWSRHFVLPLPNQYPKETKILFLKNEKADFYFCCAVAADAGDGYIVVGVKEENGRAVRPVVGIN